MGEIAVDRWRKKTGIMNIEYASEADICLWMMDRKHTKPYDASKKKLTCIFVLDSEIKNEIGHFWEVMH